MVTYSVAKSERLVVSEHRNKPKDIITVPKKETFDCFTLSRY